MVDYQSNKFGSNDLCSSCPFGLGFGAEVKASRDS